MYKIKIIIVLFVVLIFSGCSDHTNKTAYITIGNETIIIENAKNIYTDGTPKMNDTKIIVETEDGNKYITSPENVVYKIDNEESEIKRTKVKSFDSFSLIEKIFISLLVILGIASMIFVIFLDL